MNKLSSSIFQWLSVSDLSLISLQCSTFWWKSNIRNESHTAYFVWVLGPLQSSHLFWHRSHSARKSPSFPSSKLVQHPLRVHSVYMIRMFSSLYICLWIHLTVLALIYSGIELFIRVHISGKYIAYINKVRSVLVISLRGFGGPKKSRLFLSSKRPT